MSAFVALQKRPGPLRGVCFERSLHLLLPLERKRERVPLTAVPIVVSKERGEGRESSATATLESRPVGAPFAEPGRVPPAVPTGPSCVGVVGLGGQRKRQLTLHTARRRGRRRRRRRNNTQFPLGVKKEGAIVFCKLPSSLAVHRVVGHFSSSGSVSESAHHGARDQLLRQVRLSRPFEFQRRPRSGAK